jgi:nucleoid-associated protein YgaU
MARKLVVLAIVLLAAAFLFSCKTAPKPTEEPAVTEEKPPEPAPQVTEKPPEKPAEAPPEKPAPVSDQEIREARNAIARALEAEADYYDPATLKEAKEALDAALLVRQSDPETARKHLARAKERANTAFDNSVVKAAQALAERAARLKSQLLAISADRFLPDEYNAAVAGIPQTEALFKSGKLVEAREQAYATLADMSNLLERLRERQRWVDVLKRDFGQYMKEAETLGANVRAPERFQRANALYLQGVEAYQKYQLFEAEDYLIKAREEALALVQIAKSTQAEQKEKARALMLQVMNELKDASTLTVVTDDGTLIKPEAWSGDQYLEETLPAEEQPKPAGQSRALRALRAAPRGTGEQLLLIGGGAGPLVLGDTAEENLLAQAKEMWRQGVQEWNNGNYSTAEEYFAESRKLTEAYKAQAVNPNYPIYVVRLIPDRRDCLWRIAEYKFIYANPYLWPKIWRRNRKLIQHPDLIYPGWKLVIPPS